MPRVWFYTTNARHRRDGTRSTAAATAIRQLRTLGRSVVVRAPPPRNIATMGTCFRQQSAGRPAGRPTDLTTRQAASWCQSADIAKVAGVRTMYVYYRPALDQRCAGGRQNVARPRTSTLEYSAGCRRQCMATYVLDRQL